MAEYVLEGPSWTAAGAGGPAVTWAVDATIPTAWISLISDAFAQWSRYADIQFARVSSTITANIDFSHRSIDGRNGTLGQATYYFSGQSMRDAAVVFDRDEGWHASGSQVVSNSGASLSLVALHEIGHAIGLGHENDVPAVMSSIINGSLRGLTESDIAGARALYGPAAGGVPTSVHSSLNPVFRFYDSRTGDHFYTTSVVERQHIVATVPSYVLEGSFWSTPDDGPGTHDVFRFYNAASGDHLFTDSVAERDGILRSLPAYVYEGVAFQAYDSPAVDGATTLTRFYNTATGLHHFAFADEAAGIRRGGAGAHWVDEGPGFTVHLPVDGMHVV